MPYAESVQGRLRFLRARPCDGYCGRKGAQMSDLRERALAALSGACWPDEAEYLKGLMRIETALRDARAAGIREAAEICKPRADLPKGNAWETGYSRGAQVCLEHILALIEKE